MKKTLLLLTATFSFTFAQSQCTSIIPPQPGHVQVTTNSTINASGTIYWICSGLTVTIASSQGDNYICENNVTLNIINSAGDNVYAKPGCIINNSSTQAISVICDSSTVTLNNTGSGAIIVTQCLPVIYDYSLIGGSGSCAVTGIKENELSEISVYPNPFSSSITLQADNLFKDATLTVYNCFGQTAKQIKNINGQTIIFHRDNLPSGLYFIRITQDNKIFTTDKVVITDN